MQRERAKWTPKEREVLRQLFEGKKWDILAFRTLITPFYLRWDISSRWYGKWIIPRIRVRPKPKICDPQDYEFERDLTRAFHQSTLFKRGRDGLVMLNDIKFRADEVRKMAWSTIFQSIKRGSKQAEIEKAITEWYPKVSETGRLQALKNDLCDIVGKGERYIICSSSIFLMTLAVYVCSPPKPAYS